MRLWSILLAVLLSASAFLAVPVAAAPLSEEQAAQALSDMRQAYASGDSRRLEQLLPLLNGHPLEPLAAYWYQRNRLERSDAAEILAFLERYRGSYYEDRLRNDWLLLLGAQGDWPRFREQWPLFRMRDDREVECYGLLAQYLDNRAPVAEQVARLWLAQKEADRGCAAAAGVLLSQRHMPAEVAWRRARLGMEAGRRRVATQAVELLNPDWSDRVASIYAFPERYLNDKLTAVRSRTKELVTLALVRLSVTNADAAEEHLDRLRWRTQLTREELDWVWGVLGKRAAMRLSPDALSHFAHAQVQHLHSDHLSWMARAALRAGQWTQVETAITAMPASQRQETVWTYWQARAWQQRGTPESMAQARQVFERLAGIDDFYAQLSLEALGQAVQLPPAPAPLTPAEHDAVRRDPGLQRALLAIELGLRSEGVREWNYTVALHTPGGMNDRELLAAAHLACEEEIWDRCINTSLKTRQEVDMRQRFPTPFLEQVRNRAQAIGLDPAYVYGLIRQESRFITAARSHVGASGLMQVMPATAQWTARKIGLNGFHPSQISDRDTNITIGTAFLKYVLDDFEGSMAMATAAYNAGPSRPRNWRNGPVLEAPIWIENIPFDETRDYVKRVLANTNQYAALLTGRPQRPSQRLSAIGPRQLDAREPDKDIP